MKDVIIFGTGSTGQKVFELLSGEENIIGFMDNNEQVWGKTIFGKPVLGNARHVMENEFDKLVNSSRTSDGKVQIKILVKKI